MIDSIPADSNKPCTTNASDSCSVSNTFTRTAFGSVIAIFPPATLMQNLFRMQRAPAACKFPGLANQATGTRIIAPSRFCCISRSALFVTPKRNIGLLALIKW
jgi:hypothetical protein